MDESLGRLRAAIDGLPASIRTGRRDGPLVKYLTPALSKDDEPQPVFPSHKDGPLVSRGKHGLILAYTWAAHYAPLVAPDELFLVELRIQTLLALITAAKKERKRSIKGVKKGYCEWAYALHSSRISGSITGSDRITKPGIIVNGEDVLRNPSVIDGFASFRNTFSFLPLLLPSSPRTAFDDPRRGFPAIEDALDAGIIPSNADATFFTRCRGHNILLGRVISRTRDSGHDRHLGIRVFERLFGGLFSPQGLDVGTRRRACRRWGSLVFLLREVDVSFALDFLVVVDALDLACERPVP
ncbi:hypothetical protein B0H17DRAFT_1238116 [Mycena rosella]|uniref:Uncharacterized protein n=1 Tax=Mycena rosella TaxID=1033263 RepID=A0AAD7GCI0_MYCRO|nr:hypothetical protein B0H17DRAFT_1238116 [Mycena rosella]